MQRILEPELMDDAEQALAYDQADFSESHGRRVALFMERYAAELSDALNGWVLDIGCGSGDVLERFARALPKARFVAVDGSAAMLELAKRRIAKEAHLASRVQFVEAFVPSPVIPKLDYAVIMSHSMLHHLHQPAVLWNTVKQVAGSRSYVFVADLRRPESSDDAARIVDAHSANEPEVLRRDYYNSLCAAFTPQEVERQMVDTGLTQLSVEAVGDVHMLIHGYIGSES